MNVTVRLGKQFPESSLCLPRQLGIETNSDGRAEDVRFRTIPTPTPTGGGYVGGMVAQGVSKDCIFNEDFRYVLKFAVGAVIYELG